jgi:hypothetical protein
LVDHGETLGLQEEGKKQKNNGIGTLCYTMYICAEQRVIFLPFAQVSIDPQDKIRYTLLA